MIVRCCAENTPDTHSIYSIMSSLCTLYVQCTALNAPYFLLRANSTARYASLRVRSLINMRSFSSLKGFNSLRSSPQWPCAAQETATEGSPPRPPLSEHRSGQAPWGWAFRGRGNGTPGQAAPVCPGTP